MRSFFNSLNRSLFYTLFIILLILFIPLVYYLFVLFGLRARLILLTMVYIYPVVCAWEVHKVWEFHRRSIREESEGRLFTSIREDERKADQGHYSWGYITILMVITAVILLLRLLEPNFIGTNSGLCALIIFVASILIYLKRQREKNAQDIERRNHNLEQ